MWFVWNLYGHRVDGGCEEKKKLGAIVEEKDIDKLVFDLSSQTLPDFKKIDIPESATLMEQMIPRCNYLVLHAYAELQTLGNLLTQDSTREDTNYMCVTAVFKGAIFIPCFTYCFVRTSKVTSWMTKSMVNKKHVIIGTLDKQLLMQKVQEQLVMQQYPEGLV